MDHRLGEAAVAADVREEEEGAAAEEEVMSQVVLLPEATSGMWSLDVVVEEGAAEEAAEEGEWLH